MSQTQQFNTIIFDLGAVLIDWHPDHLYKKIIPDPGQRKWFYEQICTSDWNEEQDAGRPLQEATDMLVNSFPDYEEWIRAYYGRWEEMLNGPVWGTLEIFNELRSGAQHRLIALTNWSAETFPIALRKFEFLHQFDGRVVSGEEKTRKPFPEIYHTLISRYEVDPVKAVFIDDNIRNLYPAENLGMKTHHFKSPEGLRGELNQLGILKKI